MVELEITETGGGFENNTFSELIARFSGYGLSFSLDDLGSSYSNLSMLADLDFRSVKLDRSMTRNIATNRVSQMMVRDIAKICDSRACCSSPRAWRRRRKQRPARQRLLLRAGLLLRPPHARGRI